MSYYEVTTCRLAIRLCIGYGPNGRKKHRTFSMKNINPNASWEGIMAVIRALAPVLEFPIVDVQKVTSRKIIFYEDAVLPVPREMAEPEVPSYVESRKVIPFPVAFRQPATCTHMAKSNYRNADYAAKTAKILPFSPAAVGWSSRQMELPSNRAPPLRAS